MQIDWLTFAAQIVNFAILVFLLKRLLYDRIVHAMDERERRISDRGEEAKRRVDEANEEKAEYQRQQRELDEQREDLLGEARQEAEEERQRLLRGAREEIAAQRERWVEALKRQQDRFLGDLRRETAQQVIAIARRALREMADSQVERRMSGAFVRKLKEADDEQTRAFVRAAGEKEGKLLVRSSAKLPQESADEIRAALKETMGASAEIEFTRDQDLICGIEVAAAGHRLSWSLDRYLDDLEQRVGSKLSAMQDSKHQAGPRERSDQEDESRDEEQRDG